MSIERAREQARVRRNHAKKKRPRWLRLLIALAQITLLLLVIGVGAVVWVYKTYGADLPSVEHIGRHRPFETTRIYARDGTTLLYEMFDPNEGQRTIVPFSEFPEVLKQATIAVEDANFYENPGVDWRGIVRALWLNRGGEIQSGGSTITQQLVRNVLLPPEERTEQSYRRKIREAILAYRVSKSFSKDQTLALYLNDIPYGNLSYGAEAAAQNYFGVHVSELSLAQASLLAGLPQSPSELNPLVDPEAAKARQRIVLDLMVKNGYITQQQADDAYAEDLVVREAKVYIQHPHFVFFVRDLLAERYGDDLLNRGGLRIVTSLDPHWQSTAEQIVHDRVAELRDRQASNGALIVLDRESNQILAMVGSADYDDASIDGQVNVALADRQPGSSLKPLVYAAALMQGWSPATVIWDVPTTFGGTAGEPYKPKNYDGQFHGPVPVRAALANSYNIPAIKALEYAGIDPFLEVAHAAGITTLRDRERYGLSLALGSGEVRLLDLTNAYSTLSNGGRVREPVAILRVENSRGEVLEVARTEKGQQVLGPRGEQIAYLITSILSDNEARAPMFGHTSALELDDGRPAAVKTGTTDEERDSWAIGYTPQIVVGAWVGNSDNAPMDRVPGSFGGATLWKGFMQAYHADIEPTPFQRPPDIVELQICRPSGMLATAACPDVGTELFIAGKEPQQADTWFRRVSVGEDGSCIANNEQGQERVFAVLPPEAQGWAGYQPPPSRTCAPRADEADLALAIISAPADGATVRAPVLIRGSARGRYTLEVGTGASPTAWTEIASGAGGVSGGQLGLWEAQDLPAGVYTLRLTVLSLSGRLVSTVTVTLDSAAPALTMAPAPEAQLQVGTAIQLTATVSDTSAVRVEFLANGRSLGIAEGAPYAVSWTPDRDGLHLLEAVATDAAGNVTRSGSFPVTVRPSP